MRGGLLGSRRADRAKNHTELSPLQGAWSLALANVYPLPSGLTTWSTKLPSSLPRLEFATRNQPSNLDLICQEVK